MFSRSKKPTPPKPAAQPPVSAADAIAPEDVRLKTPQHSDGAGRMSAELEERKHSTVAEDGPPTVIQREMELSGLILTDGAIELYGSHTGDVCAKGFTLGDTGVLKGDIVAEEVVISGHGEGRITARRVRLSAGARYRGDILHQRLSVEDGAEFEGAVLRKTDESAWAEISKTFETPGVELTEAAVKAVDALKAEFEKRSRR